MKTVSFIKGDIIWVKRNRRNPQELRHPAVVWDESVEDDADFHGIMLSHSPRSERFDNILMSIEHFEVGSKVTFSNTHFVNQLFIKFQEWGPFYKVGKITARGIEFIETNLSQTEPLSFEFYR